MKEKLLTGLLSLDARLAQPDAKTVSLCIITLAAITLALFADVLFGNGDLVLSQYGCDLSLEHLQRRFFAVQEMRQGNFPLWNPHIYCGMPFLGSMQSALLYPLNALYLVLPLGRAINASIALHVFLGGLFMFWWTLRRGIHPLACLVSGILFMCCGAHFLHIYAGHLSNLCALIWAPLIFLCIDGLHDTRDYRWCLPGIAAVSLQVLAGHPQYVLFTGIMASVYILFLLPAATNRRRLLLGYIGMYAGAALLTAVQLLPAIETALESARFGMRDPSFAGRFAFPVENIITLITPYFFGGGPGQPYFGRQGYWEVCAYIGLIAIALAAFGATRGNTKIRRWSLALAMLAIILALGRATPLFGMLAAAAPGFDRFRGSAKFMLFADMFLIMLSAAGLDRILKEGVRSHRFAAALTIAAIIMITVSILIRASAASGGGERWVRFFTWLFDFETMARSLNANQTLGVNTAAIRGYGLHAAGQLFAAGSATGLLAALFLCMARYPRYKTAIAYILSIAAIIEITLFARAQRPSFSLATAFRSAATPVYAAATREDGRVLNLINPNMAMLSKGGDIMGNDPAVSRRYIEFLAVTQEQNPDTTAECTITKMHPLFAMLRLRYIVLKENTKPRLAKFPGALPQLSLINDFRVLKNRDAILATMLGKTGQHQSSAFNPARTVILESDPQPAPVINGRPGTVTLLQSGTDRMLIEAILPDPAILLITDTYSPGWRAYPLAGSAQKHYSLMPANYILRAVPLCAGHHRLNIAYLPDWYRAGKWVSLLSIAGFILIAGWFLKTHFSMNTPKV